MSKSRRVPYELDSEHYRRQEFRRKIRKSHELALRIGCVQKCLEAKAEKKSDFPG